MSNRIEKINRETILKYADICRHNARKAEYYQASSQIVQIWELLALSIDVLTIPETSGGLISWNESCLGYPLLHRVICHQLQCKDIVTIGAVICVFCGSRGLRELLENFPLKSSQSRNQFIDTQRSRSYSSSEFDIGLPLYPEKGNGKSTSNQSFTNLNEMGNSHIPAPNSISNEREIFLGN